MSKIEVNAIEPQCGTTLTVGASGDTITFPSGTTVVNNGSQTGFGRTGTVDWDTTPKTGTFTAVSGVGYFVDTSSGVSTANLPAGVAGAIVSFADYTRTFQTNNLTITPNGSEKIGGVAANFVAQTEGQSITLVYVDATEGWINTAESTGQSGVVPAFITATGGTITTVCTDYKVHTFTGPGTFCVSSLGNAPGGGATVAYMVIAGAGGGGSAGGGGGAGGFREGKCSVHSYTASPLATTGLEITSTGAIPITVGGGGAGGTGNGTGTKGSDAVFSTISSAGGGAGRGHNVTPNPANTSGGSGGGGGSSSTPNLPAGSGNTPPVSPSQGNDGATGQAPFSPSPAGGGGGGAGAAFSPAVSLNGGTGATTSINGTPTARAGGGGAGPNGSAGPGGGGSGGTPGGGPTGVAPAGTANTGGGGGGGAPFSGSTVGGAGGSGIVIIRYKFQ